jgi:membrane-associated phospholipid phosphatase
MKYLRKSIISAITLLALTAQLLIYLQMAIAAEKLPTYFSYNSSQLSSLQPLSSLYKMNVTELQKWDNIMFDLVKKHKLGGIAASRLYTYMYTAQREAAFLSYDIKQEYLGTLDPISARVLGLFFSNERQSISAKIKTDRYSEKLADLVLAKIKLRLQLDKRNIKAYPEKKDRKNYWLGTRPFIGQDEGSSMTWLINSSRPINSPAPPTPQSKIWLHELEQTKTALKNVSPEQIKTVIYWAGEPSTITLAGIWLKIANDYMNAQDVTFTKRLQVRATLAMGLADAMTAVFHVKYSYWIKRPNMLDKSIRTVIVTPNHPTYPSGHAALSGAAATILTFYFPDHKKQWWRQANEGNQSRIFAGIHFPIDTRDGLILGKKVGNAIIAARNSQH